jgi:hypothetical protein
MLRLNMAVRAAARSSASELRRAPGFSMGFLGMPACPLRHTLRAQRQLCTKGPTPTPTLKASPAAPAPPPPSGGYAAFAKANPNINNLAIATLKTGAADLVAQCVIERKPLSEVDWQRNLVFCLFGACYLGAFQYWYQVNVFKRLFPGVERFTSQAWSAKLTDVPGLLGLAGQTVLDMFVLTFVYLPTFYIFKSGVFSTNWNVTEWADTGVTSYRKNWDKDVSDLCKVWIPADLICFSVPLWLRLPVRHIVSFAWTAYLSFVRGGH